MPKANKLITAKFTPPKAQKGFLERTRLLELLSRNRECKTTLITAPAGYGKTVLLLQYLHAHAQNTGDSTVWYQVDSCDLDPVNFLRNLLLCIRQTIPDFGRKIEQAITTSNLKKGLHEAAALFANELTAGDAGLILILDDFHEIKSPEIHDFLLELIPRLPAATKIFIAGRVIPPVFLSRLLVASAAIHLDAEDLRFDRNEIKLFMTGQSESLSEEQMEFLEQETAGWPAALQLTKLYSRGKTARAAMKKRPDVHNFLTMEVLRQQPAEVESFLLETSVLKTLTPELCDSLLDKANSAEILHFIENRQLFLTPLAGGEQAYRYHQLFQEFLLKNLKPARRKELSVKAGDIFLQAGDAESAVEYFLSGGAHRKAAEVMEEIGYQVVRQGRWQTVLGWMDSLTDEYKRQNPRLALVQGTAEILRGRISDAEPWIGKAIALFTRQKDEKGLAESLIQKARLLRSKGLYQQSLDLLNQALPDLLKDRSGHYFEVSLEKSMSLTFTGRFDQAENLLKRAMTLAEKDCDSYVTAHIAEGLGNLYFLKGDYSKAMQMYYRGSRAMGEPVLAGYYMRDSVALIYRDWGQLDEALEYAKRSVEVKESMGLAEALPYAYQQLGSVYLDYGEFGLAEHYFRAAIKLCKESGSETIFLVLNLLMLTKCRLVQNKLTEARALTEEALTIAAGQSEYVLAFAKEMAAPVMIQTGNLREGVNMLMEATPVLEKIGAKYPLCLCYGALAKVFAGQGDLEKARYYTEQCLALAARDNYMQIFLTFFDLLAPVLKFGLETGKEVGFVQKALARLGRRGLCILQTLAAHPFEEVRLRVILPLAEIATEESKGLILTLLEDPVLQVRETAKVMAARLGFAPAKQETAYSEPLININCLGTFRVYSDRAEIRSNQWRTRKVRDLLAYLLHFREPAPLDRILDDLWPEVEEEKAKVIFHTTLYQLRQALAKAFGRKKIIRHKGGCYELDLRNVTVDYRRMETLTLSLGGPSQASQGTAERLEEALSLYRGDYLAELDYIWVIPEQERLKEFNERIRLRLVQIYLDHREYDKALDHLRLLIKMRPYAENIVRLLLEVYYCLGDYGEAKRKYQQFSDALQSELGLTPSLETVKLYEKICGRSKAEKP